MMIDDFTVAAPAEWPIVGAALLDVLRHHGRIAGWRQIIAVCASDDTAKTAFLHSTDLTIASTWWTAVT